jgi:2-polyprenyl-6-methoxyphenol hydroxylase-like FAD-dependent oxidoreductase
MSTEAEPSVIDVVIVGAGPTGLLLAGDLAAAGVRAVVLDRAAEPVKSPKGNGVVGRAALELRRRKLLRGTGLRVRRPPRFPFGPFTLDLGLLRGPLHVLPVPQHRLECLLADRAVRHGAKILRGCEVTGFDQDRDGVTVQAVAEDARVGRRTRYLVGCDGARSFVRKSLGIGFPGITSNNISRLARITMPAGTVTRVGEHIELRGIGQLAPFRPNRTKHGSITITPADALDRSASDDVYIVSTHEPRGDSEPTDELSDDELRASLRRVLGTDLPYTMASAARSVVANSRHVERYREGRAFLAGDAAHIFSAGGSAINAGLLDAIALAKPLAAVLHHAAPQTLLDTYQSQRHPATQRTLALTRLQIALEASDETGEALCDVLGELVLDRAATHRIATIIEG